MKSEKNLFYISTSSRADFIFLLKMIIRKMYTMSDTEKLSSSLAVLAEIFEKVAEMSRKGTDV